MPDFGPASLNISKISTCCRGSRCQKTTSLTVHPVVSRHLVWFCSGVGRNKNKKIACAAHSLWILNHPLPSSIFQSSAIIDTVLQYFFYDNGNLPLQHFSTKLMYFLAWCFFFLPNIAMSRSKKALTCLLILLLLEQQFYPEVKINSFFLQWVGSGEGCIRF